MNPETEQTFALFPPSGKLDCRQEPRPSPVSRRTAAKGAKPAGFVLTLALRGADDAWLKPFAQGLGEDAAKFGCPLLGGDTVSTPGPLMISVTAFGRLPQGKMVHRSGARPGDRVVVTGTIGDAALGLDVLKGGAVAGALASDAVAREALIARYRVPQPRNALAKAVRDHASAQRRYRVIAKREGKH